jgi:predicted dehydrogenase
VHFTGSLRFPGSGLATFHASFISALQQTYSVVGSDRAIDLPQDAFIPWEHDAVYSVRERNQEQGTEHIIPGMDEYQLMVEHFADAVMGNAALAIPPEESVLNLRVLDALKQAAQRPTTRFPCNVWQ